MSGEHAHPEVAALEAALAALVARVDVLTGQVTALEAGEAALVTRVAGIEERVAALATWHDYSGKPGTTQVVKAGDYVRLDVDVADPPRSGVAEFHLVYANCALSFASGATSGVIRVKYRREDGDETAFQDFHVTRSAALGSPPSFLLTHTHFEVGQAGLGGRWYIRCGNGLTSISLGTRYVKIMQVS